jgi:aspartate-semialdehyde dehydrogenase
LEIRKIMDSRFLEGEKFRALCRQVPVGGGEFIEAGLEFKRDWDYAEMLRKEIEKYLIAQYESYRSMGLRPLSSATRWIGENFYIYLFGKSSSGGERMEFHVSGLCEGKCSASILKKLIEELEELDASRLNKALVSMI